jgi:protein SCO1/2
LPADARARLLALCERHGAATAAPDCCQPLSARLAAFRGRGSRGLGRVRVRAVDQDGAPLGLAQHCRGRVTLLAFFYTRCDNPNKCSLTVTRLAALQRQLRQAAFGESVQLLGISYDSAYDSPALLKTFGAARGFRFGARDRFLRVHAEDFPALAGLLELGVNYAGSVVNQHAIELFLVDGEARVRHVFKRLRWSEPEVVVSTEQLVAELGSRRAGGLRRALGAASSLGLALSIALFPKCPLCWAAYAGVLGVFGLGTLPYSPWLLPVLVALLLLNLWLLGRGLLKSRRAASRA